jgi:hypothetical protein
MRRARLTSCGDRAGRRRQTRSFGRTLLRYLPKQPWRRLFHNTKPPDRIAADAYRSEHPYDTTGYGADWDGDPGARLTIDLAAGDRWLIALTRKATMEWLATSNPVLDYANAMVPGRQPHRADKVTANWQEHVDGKPQYNPPILPLAPAKFTGSLYITTGYNPTPECGDFQNSLTSATGDFVQAVAPNGAGMTDGMLGYMFWAAECPGTRSLCTTPPNNTCEGGVGIGAQTYGVPIPMPPLRQY